MSLINKVWLALPVATFERSYSCLRRWKELGYRLAVWVDPGFPVQNLGVDLYIQEGPYPGYYTAVNKLCAKIGDEADIVVTAGDDMFPHPGRQAIDIGREFVEHFNGTLGIMQPIGDNYAGTANICGSPWLGREYIKRGYQGKGPFWGGYYHFYADEELKRVSESLKLLWQRPDVSQLHRHYSRQGGLPRMPYHVQNDKHWIPDQTLFNQRKAAGFPEHGLL